jgi:hypothetical protein
VSPSLWQYTLHGTLGRPLLCVALDVTGDGRDPLLDGHANAGRIDHTRFPPKLCFDVTTNVHITLHGVPPSAYLPLAPSARSTPTLLSGVALLVAPAVSSTSPSHLYRSKQALQSADVRI